MKKLCMVLCTLALLGAVAFGDAAADIAKVKTDWDKIKNSPDRRSSDPAKRAEWRELYAPILGIGHALAGPGNLTAGATELGYAKQLEATGAFEPFYLQQNILLLGQGRINVLVTAEAPVALAIVQKDWTANCAWPVVYKATVNGDINREIGLAALMPGAKHIENSPEAYKYNRSFLQLRFVASIMRLAADDAERYRLAKICLEKGDVVVVSKYDISNDQSAPQVVVSLAPSKTEAVAALRAYLLRIATDKRGKEVLPIARRTALQIEILGK